MKKITYLGIILTSMFIIPLSIKAETYTLDYTAYNIGDEIEVQVSESGTKAKFNLIQKSDKSSETVIAMYGGTIGTSAWSTEIINNYENSKVKKELESIVKSANWDTYKTISLVSIEQLEKLGFKDNILDPSLNNSSWLLSNTPYWTTKAEVSKNYGCPVGYSCATNAACPNDYHQISENECLSNNPQYQITSYDDSLESSQKYKLYETRQESIIGSDGQLHGYRTLYIYDFFPIINKPVYYTVYAKTVNSNGTIIDTAAIETGINIKPVIEINKGWVTGGISLICTDCSEDEEKYCPNKPEIKLDQCIETGLSEGACIAKLCFSNDETEKYCPNDSSISIQSCINDGESEANCITKLCPADEEKIENPTTGNNIPLIFGVISILFGSAYLVSRKHKPFNKVK